LELSYDSCILQIKAENATWAMRGAKVQVTEDLDGKIEINFHEKKLEYKELLVKDSQGRIINKKEAAARVFPPRGKETALNF